MDLPKTRKRILRHLVELQRMGEVLPSYQELGEQLGLKSKSTVAYHVGELERSGYLRKDSVGAISWVEDTESEKRGVEEASEALPVQTVPLFGSIPASPPTEVYAHDEQLAVPAPFVGGGGRVFALTVTGDSMIGADIHDGDTVFIRCQEEARDGQIVAAMINGETTLKRFRRAGDRVIFNPENPTMGPILTTPEDDVRIIGVLTGFYRQLD